jgi:hypothetical protein
MYNKIKLRNSAIALFVTILSLASLTGCSGIYENIREYATEEEVYSNRFDGILKVSLGLERVEIDLMKAGRVPASEIYMGRARKTVIECEDFTEPDHRRVIDSVCSYINITGLTQLKTYQFTIYTEDSYGNRSMPLVAEARPYTRSNLEGLSIVPPNVLGSSSAALLEWKDKITTRLFELLHYTYQYTDKDGVVHTGEGDSDPPSFFIENVLTGQEIPIIMTSRIIPALLNDGGYYTPIIDTVDLQTTVIIKISPDAGAVIFLKEPSPGAEISFPQKFSWVSVHEVDDYVLKISSSATFSENQTLTFPVGNSGEYELTEDDLKQIADSVESYRVEIYWTVEPASNNADNVTVQRRRISFIHPDALLPLPAPVGLWEFEDPMMPFKATIGKELNPKMRTGNGVHSDDPSGFTAIAGPSAGNGALHVLKNYWMQCEHGLKPSAGLTGSDNYTLIFDIRLLSPSSYHSLLETSQSCNTDQDFCINSALSVGIGTTGYYAGGITYNNWYRIAITYKDKIIRYYVNGLQIGERTAAIDSRFLISPIYVNLFGDEDGDMNEFDVSEVRLYDHGLKPYQVAAFGDAGTK